MASASSSSSSSEFFELFISHHFPVIKNTFVSRLYRLLISHGFGVFLNKPETQVGHDIPSQIEATIRNASLHVPIFSPTYAESQWCLNELLLMVESVKSGRATILPVFYNVKPSDLRHGAYAEALSCHEQKHQVHDLQTIRNWRDVLCSVAEITGIDLDNGDEWIFRDEDELLDKVLQNVLKIVPPQLHVAKHPTGSEDKLIDFLIWMLMHRQGERDEAKVVGIVGSGGVGKTTLVTKFFNRRKADYAVSSFLPHVRETAAKMSLNSLQSKLIKDLQDMDIKIERVDEGRRILETNLKSCHALIVFDDVDHIDQMDALLTNHVLDPKSLILITSRYTNVLRSLGIPETLVYKMTGFNLQHSLQLFCTYAFFQPYPPPGFEILVNNFAMACNGLPLCLKMFGALLCGVNDRSQWEEVLDEVKCILTKDTMKMLKITYDSLNEEEQQIVLDIACFCIGKDRDLCTEIWHGSGWRGLVGFRNLEDKCFVEVDTENKIRMPDHVRDMGRDISACPYFPRRVLRATIEDLCDLLKQSSGITQVRGIIMDQRETFDEPLFYSKSKMLFDKSSIGNLNFLEANGNFVESILTRVRSPKLMWLKWNKCPHSSLPSWLPMRDLRVLEVSGRKLEILWQCESEVPTHLLELNIDAPLRKFPESLGQLKLLKKIVAEEAYLATLPEEFCYLPYLKYLKLKDYQMLPNSTGDFTNLQLTDGRSLEMLSDSMDNLTNLNLIDLEQCTSLEMLLTAIVWRHFQNP